MLTISCERLGGRVKYVTYCNNSGDLERRLGCGVGHKAWCLWGTMGRLRCVEERCGRRCDPAD